MIPPLSIMFAVTILIAGASQPIIQFVTAPDEQYAQEFVLSDTYGEVVCVEEVPLPPVKDQFANEFFTIDPQIITTYPLSDTVACQETLSQGRRMAYKDRIVEITDIYPDGSAGVVDIMTDEFLVVNALLLEEYN